MSGKKKIYTFPIKSKCVQQCLFQSEIVIQSISAACILTANLAISNLSVRSVKNYPLSGILVIADAFQATPAIRAGGIRICNAGLSACRSMPII